MAHRTKLTLNAREKFLDGLRAGHTVTHAARSIGMRRQSLYEHRDAEPDFKVEWDRAVDEGVEVLEQEAYRRAVDGTVKPVFHQGKLVTDDQGNPVDVREYSDKLLELLLKAKKPKVYRDNATVEHVGKDGGPIETRELSNAQKAERIASLFNHVAERVSN